MSADVLPFPAVTPRRGGPPEPGRACKAGDIIVTLFNASLSLWCAWPVIAVDDDGVVAMVASRSGRRLAAERVSCDPVCFGFACEDHEPLAFNALLWRTWRSSSEALEAFAAIGKAAPTTGGTA